MTKGGAKGSQSASGDPWSRTRRQPAGSGLRERERSQRVSQRL